MVAGAAKFPGSSPATVPLGPYHRCRSHEHGPRLGDPRLLETTASRPRRPCLAAIRVAVAAVAITGLARTATAHRGQARATCSRPPFRTHLTAILAAAAVSTVFAAVAVASPVHAADPGDHGTDLHLVLASRMAGLGRWWLASRRRPIGAGRPAAPPTPEYFRVVSTKPSGPGTIIVTGVVNAGGTEKPGRVIDGATFAGGSFRIYHSAGPPTVRFDATTCVGTISQVGPFEVIDATGDMGGLAGCGRCVFEALYTTARVAGHCSSTMTAYTETIERAATVKA